MTHKPPCISHLADCDTLLTLAEHVEALDGPCHETDGDIFKALNPDGVFMRINGVWMLRDELDVIAFEAPPEFTGSIDAAASLMPEGWKYRFVSFHNNIWVCNLEPLVGTKHIASPAKTEPNARTAAALRAIHAERSK